MFGLESDLHWFSWYLYFYIYAMIIMPFAAKMIDKYGWKALAVLIVGSYLLEVGVHIIPNWSDNIWTHAIFDCQLNTPLLLLGYYLASNKMYSKITLQKKHTWLFVLLLLTVFVSLLSLRVIAGFLLSFVYVPLIILAIVGLFSLYDMPILRQLLTKLGDMSMPMWFIHALFIMPFATMAWFRDWM